MRGRVEGGEVAEETVSKRRGLFGNGEKVSFSRVRWEPWEALRDLAIPSLKSWPQGSREYNPSGYSRSFLVLSNTPLYINLPVDGNLSYFQFGPMIHEVVLGVRVHVCMDIFFLLSCVNI